MKKVLMAVLSAVCFSMVAQASAMTWSCGSVKETLSHTISTVAPGQTASLAVAVSLTGGTDLEINYNVIGGLDGGRAITTIGIYMQGGEVLDNIVVLNLTADSAGNLTMALFFNTNLRGTLNASNPLTVELLENSSYFQITSAAVYDSALTEDQMKALVAANDARALASVPEPTVLALLALGVAGLALKRRV